MATIFQAPATSLPASRCASEGLVIFIAGPLHFCLFSTLPALTDAAEVIKL